MTSLNVTWLNSVRSEDESDHVLGRIGGGRAGLLADTKRRSGQNGVNWVRLKGVFPYSEVSAVLKITSRQRITGSNNEGTGEKDEIAEHGTTVGRASDNHSYEQPTYTQTEEMCCKNSQDLSSPFS